MLLNIWHFNVLSQLIDETGDGGANYLSAGYDQFDPVDEILDALSPSRIPNAPVGVGDFEAETNTQDAIEAILSIASIFTALNKTSERTQKVEAYSARCYQRLVDHWGGLTQWIFHLVLHASNLTNPRLFLLRCALALEVIICDAEGNAYKEDLVAQNRTVDLVYLLLCQVDQNDGRSHYISELDSSSDCPIVELLRSSLRSRTGIAAMTARLETVSHGTRNGIVTSVLGRCQEIAELAKDPFLSRAAYAIRCLVSSTLCLVMPQASWVSFQRRDFLTIQGRALALLCNKARESRGDSGASFWETISGTIFTLVATTTHRLVVNPSARVRTLVEAGILEIALQCLQVSTVKPSSGGVYEALGSLLPYMASSKVYEAVTRRGDVELWDSTKESMPSSPRKIWESYAFVFGANHYAYEARKASHVNMCGNVKVSQETCLQIQAFLPYFAQHHLAAKFSPLSDNTDALRVCVCHSVAYCSDLCQKKDWNAFHSRECASLVWQYNSEHHTIAIFISLLKTRTDRKQHNAWPSFRTKRDHVKYLEALANWLLPPPGDLRKPDPSFANATVPTEPIEVNTFECGLYSSIVTFDLVKEARLSTCLQFPLRLHLHERWGDLSFRCFQPRIQQHVTEMEANPDLILAEGITQYDARQWLSTFLVLKYTPGAPEDYRYTVVNAVCRVS